MKHHNAMRGFTLIETISVMVIVGTISAVLSTVLYAATDAYTSAESGRCSMDGASLALETLSREIRRQPAPPDSSLASGLISSADSSLEFESGLRIEQSGAALLLTKPDRPPATLLEPIDSVAFRLFADGAPDAASLGPEDEPGTARVIEISIETGSGQLTTRLFLRSSLRAGS